MINIFRTATGFAWKVQQNACKLVHEVDQRMGLKLERMTGDVLHPSVVTANDGVGISKAVFKENIKSLEGLLRKGYIPSEFNIVGSDGFKWVFTGVLKDRYESIGGKGSYNVEYALVGPV